MLTGAVGAGIGAVTGGALGLLKVEQFGYQLVARTVMGGVAGGVVSEIYGGNFWEGFAQGAGTAAAAFLFNCTLHRHRQLENQAVQGEKAGEDVKGQDQTQNENVPQRSSWRVGLGILKIGMGTADICLGTFCLISGISSGGIGLAVSIFPAIGLIGGGGMGVYYGGREIYEYFKSGDQPVESTHERR